MALTDPANLGPWSVPVREYMSSSLVALEPEALLEDAQATLLRRGISAAPVIDATGDLVGILSTTDILRVARIEMQSPQALARVWPPPHRVREVMHRDVVTIDVDAPVGEAAVRMVRHGIHRLIVTRDDRPISVVSARDAMRAILEARVTTPLSRVMTTDIKCLLIGDTIDSAVGELTDANVHGLVVLDGSWPVGVFTQHEAIKARALPPALRKTAVERIMSYETLCHNVQTPLFRVAGHSMSMNVRRILAVDHRRLVGIATGLDLMRFMAGGPTSGARLAS
jgi:predicted transcriptional regulator